MQQWQYRRASDFGLPMSDSLQRFPRERHMLAYGLRVLANLFLRAWLRVFHRLEISGSKNLVTGQSRIVVCNHTSHLDTLCLLAAMPFNQIHRTFPAAASDYFFSSTARSAFSATCINALPFDRLQGGARSLDTCAALLNEPGNTLIIFPEGTRTTNGDIDRFRSGVARLALRTAVPIIPCHLSGGLDAWPKGRLLPRPHKLRLQIGGALHYENYADMKPEELCRQLRLKVAAMEN